MRIEVDTVFEIGQEVFYYDRSEAHKRRGLHAYENESRENVVLQELPDDCGQYSGFKIVGAIATVMGEAISIQYVVEIGEFEPIELDERDCYGTITEALTTNGE